MLDIESSPENNIGSQDCRRKKKGRKEYKSLQFYYCQGG
jgi:hypothetical protein